MPYDLYHLGAWFPCLTPRGGRGRGAPSQGVATPTAFEAWIDRKE
jgi:hypothetical protein